MSSNRTRVYPLDVRIERENEFRYHVVPVDFASWCTNNKVKLVRFNKGVGHYYLIVVAFVIASLTLPTK
jgi:hypothetical protein